MRNERWSFIVTIIRPVHVYVWKYEAAVLMNFILSDVLKTATFSALCCICFCSKSRKNYDEISRTTKFYFRANLIACESTKILTYHKTKWNALEKYLEFTVLVSMVHILSQCFCVWIFICSQFRRTWMSLCYCHWILLLLSLLVVVEFTLPMLFMTEQSHENERKRENAHTVRSPIGAHAHPIFTCT